MELQPSPAGRAAIGAGEPVFAGPQSSFEEACYPPSLAQLVRLSQDPPVSVTLMADADQALRCDAWRARAELPQHLVQVTGASGRTP